MMNQEKTVDPETSADVQNMLSNSGYSEKAIKYYLDKPYMGVIPQADQVSQMVGTCGDTMGVYLKVSQGIITDAKYEVLGCPGAISSAMAAVDLVKGKSLEYARKIDDNDIFRALENIPAKKHHCIQLAVKTLHKAIDEYEGK